MPEPHTHGGTDAPECTTCRPLTPTTTPAEPIPSGEGAER